MKVWIYLEGKQQGPFEMEDLKSKPGFDENTRVWFDGLPKWYPAGTLEQLRPLFESTGSEAVDAEAQEPGSPVTPLSQPAMHAETVYDPYAQARMYRQPAQPDEPCPPTYIGWSIFLLICCCSPLSLAALAASICVSTFYGRGNIGQAKKASELAAWLVMISFALGMIPMMIVSALMG